MPLTCDAVRPPVDGHALGQHLHRALAGGVGRDAGAAQLALHRADVDDLAALARRSCCSATAWPTMNTLSRLVRISSCQCGCSKSCSGVRRCMPALLIRMSIGADVGFDLRSTAAATASASLASKADTCTVTPSPRNCSAAVSSLPAVRPFSTMAAPAPASPRASARPMPALEPVIRRGLAAQVELLQRRLHGMPFVVGRRAA